MSYCSIDDVILYSSHPDNLSYCRSCVVQMRDLDIDKSALKYLGIIEVGIDDLPHMYTVVLASHVLVYTAPGTYFGCRR